MLVIVYRGKDGACYLNYDFIIYQYKRDEK